MPNLNIWGEGDLKDNQSASERQHLQSHQYHKFEVAGANPKFDGYEFELNQAVIQCLKGQKP